MVRRPSKNARRPSAGDGRGVAALREFLQGIPADLRPPAPESPRGRILTAARSLFAQRGFDRTSIRAIGGQAQVNQAMVHYYFGSKERLYRWVISLEMLDLFRGIVRRLEEDQPAEEILVRVPLDLMRELREHPLRRQLLRREIGQGAVHAREAVVAMQEFGPRGFRERLTALVKRGQSSGCVRDLSADVIISFLLSVAYGAFLLDPVFEVVLGGSIEDDEPWRERLRSFEDLLRHGLLTEEKEP